MEPVLRCYLELWYEMHKGMIVHWHRAETSDTVYYRVEGDTSWITQSSVTKSYPHRSETIHYVILNDLNQDTIYEFRFEGEGVEDIRRFRVLPVLKSRDLVYCVLSDHQDPLDVEHPQYLSILTEICNKNPDFVIFNGDFVNCEGEISSANSLSWSHIITTWSDHLITDTEGLLIPMLATVGNHEVTPDTRWAGSQVYPPEYMRLFFYTGWDTDHPQGNDGYGYLTAGDYLLIILTDTNHGHEIDTQTTWLENLYSELGNKYKYVVPLEHVIPYPPHRSFTGMWGEIQAIRRQWHPIFKDFGARFITCGHDHVWSLSVRINMDESNIDGYEDNSAYRSIIYCGSGPVHPNRNRSFENSSSWYMESGTSITNFWHFEVKNHEIIANGLDYQGNLLATATQTVNYLGPNAISIDSVTPNQVVINIDSYDPSAVAHHMYRLEEPIGSPVNYGVLIGENIDPTQNFVDTDIVQGNEYFYQMVSYL